MEPDPPQGPPATSDTPEVSVSPQNAPITPTKLNDIEFSIMIYIEHYHATIGDAPDDAQIQERFSNVTAETLEAFKANSLVQQSMAVRGIPYPHANDRFTQRQMSAAATMLDYKDRRSDAKKLADIGVTTREWSGWLQDNAFANYLRDRSERMLTNSLHEAHLGLIKGVRNGNTASIDKYYRISGRYNPDEENQINVKLLMHQFVEVIQKHVKDPATLHSIAAELSILAATNNVTSSVIQHNVNKRRELGS